MQRIIIMVTSFDLFLIKIAGFTIICKLHKIYTFMRTCTFMIQIV